MVSFGATNSLKETNMSLQVVSLAVDSYFYYLGVSYNADEEEY